MAVVHTQDGGAPAGPPRDAAAPEDAPAADRSAVPRDSSPTWELELLISGAVLFGLFQLPPALNGLFDRVMPHATATMLFVLVLAFWVGKATVYTLVGAFVLHLVSRAYWVGLVGLHSVFPRGVRWEALPGGPVSREMWRSRLPPLPRTIARIDNFSSVIFSFAFMIALMFLLVVVFVTVSWAAAWAVATLLFGGRHVGELFLAAAALLALPSTLAVLVDQRLGARLAPDGRAKRALRQALRAGSILSLSAVYAPILFTLTSNVRKTVIYPLLLLAFAATYVAGGVEVLGRVGRLTASSEDYFTDDAHAQAIESSYYESQWAPAQGGAPWAPSIQSDVVRDPYVRLFIPYHPARHNLVIAERCPGARPLEERGVRIDRHEHTPAADSAAAAMLACLARLHRVAINGTPRADVRLRFYTHPRTGGRGMLAYIPTADLPRGENVLTVMPAPRPANRASPLPSPLGRRRAPPPLEPHVIHFWL